MAAESNGSSDLSYRRLRAWDSINTNFKSQPNVIQYLKEIEPKVDIAGIAHFAKEFWEHKDLVERLATAKEAPHRFNVPSMRDRLAIDEFQSEVADDQISC